MGALGREDLAILFEHSVIGLGAEIGPAGQNGLDDQGQIFGGAELEEVTDDAGLKRIIDVLEVGITGEDNNLGSPLFSVE